MTAFGARRHPLGKSGKTAIHPIRRFNVVIDSLTELPLYCAAPSDQNRAAPRKRWFDLKWCALTENGPFSRKAAAALGFPVSCAAVSMTWEGHELLDKIRSHTLWNKIKAGARERAIPLSFDAVKLLGTEAIKSLIGG